jgi:hypothetical protein
MSDAQVTDNGEGAHQAAFQAAKVAKTLELLAIDPRTSELAEMIPSLMTMAAMQTGGNPEVKQGELADVFQALYEAWGAAEVHVSDARYQVARDLAGGALPVHTLS